MAAERLVVIGGDAAGMSAASQARRMKEPARLEIVVFERGQFTSYSACGIPYWVGGDVRERDDLIARTPEEHRARAIDLRMRTEVTEIDTAGQRVRFHDLDAGTDGWTGFDQLVIATGARPVRPGLPGIDAPGVHGVQTLGDGQALLDTLERATGRRAVVVGAGYIGVEMAEALLKRGYQVTVVQRDEQPMATLDPDMGRLVHAAMEGMGITVVGGAAVSAILTGEDGWVRAVAAGHSEYPADVVVLGIGVEPETTLARAAGLPVGAHGGLLTDLSMRVRGHRNIWAGGDCVEVLDLVAGAHRHIALGTHANKHGQIIGMNVGGGYGTFPGVVGTAVSKVCDLEIARTGLREKDARRARAAVRHGHHRVDEQGRLLPGGGADDGEDARGAPYREAAGGADRRPGGRGEAGRRGGGRADRRHDGGTAHGTRPRVRAAVLTGVGSGPGGGAQNDGGGTHRRVLTVGVAAAGFRPPVPPHPSGWPGQRAEWVWTYSTSRVTRVGVGTGQHTVAQVEDMAFEFRGGVEDLAGLGLHHGRRREENGRVEIALERLAGTDPAGRLVQRNAPVHPDHVGAGLAHEPEQFAGAHPEVDAGHPVGGDRVEDHGRGGHHIAAVVVGRQRAGPGVEELHRARAGLDLDLQEAPGDPGEALAADRPTTPGRRTSWPWFVHRCARGRPR